MNGQLADGPTKGQSKGPRSARIEAAHPVSQRATDRKGAARMIGKSESTVKRLEKNDPEWPKPFAVGGYLSYLIADIEGYLLHKARAAQSA
jgi:hypothetical protein